MFFIWKKIILPVLLFSFLSILHVTCGSKIKVAVFMDHTTSKYAVSLAQNYSNQVRGILPYNWEIETQCISVNDITHVDLLKATDYILESNISVIIGPTSSTSIKMLHPFAALYKIPHIAPFASDSSLDLHEKFPFLLRLSPSDVFQTQAVADILHFNERTAFSIIAIENDYGFGASTDLQIIADERGWTIPVIYQFKMSRNPNSLNVTSALEDVRGFGPHAIVLVTNAEYGHVILQQALSLNMVTSTQWHWMLMDGAVTDDNINFNNITSHYELFDGIIGTRPVMSTGSVFKDVKDWLKSQNIQEQKFNFTEQKLFDSLLLVAYGIQQSTDKQDHKPSGVEIYNGMKLINKFGMSTDLNFDSFGTTKSTEYDILFSRHGEWHVIGQWSEKSKLNIEIDWLTQYQQSRKHRLQGKVFKPVTSLHLDTHDKAILKVVTILEAPFVDLATGKEISEYKKKYKNRVYSDQSAKESNNTGIDVVLKGYCMDLLEELSQIGKFQYSIQLVKDGKYGAYEEGTKRWNGMIGDLVEQKHDLAVASITVTEERERVVDFSVNFMDIGLKYIVKASLTEGEKSKYDPFAFLLPFNLDLWHAIIASVICLAIFITLLANVSPYGVKGHFFLSHKSDDLKLLEFKSNKDNENNMYSSLLFNEKKQSTPELRRLEAEKSEALTGMGLSNALYFTWASLFWQTPETVPRAPSTRFITVVWYLAAIVFLASYTANMVAFVSEQNLHEKQKLESVASLAMQTDVPYGTIVDSSVQMILKHSAIHVAKGLYDFIEKDKETLLMPNTATALQHVKNGSYILLWDSLALDYIAWESDCKLITIDVGFGAVSYAFAFQQDSPYKSFISRKILELRESGFLLELYQKYFGYLQKCDKLRKEKESKLTNNRLSFYNLAGVFYLVYIAMAVGTVVLIIEWIVACFFDVNVSNPNAPQSLYDAFYIRQQRLCQDIVDNWFPISKIKERWQTIELPSHDSKIWTKKNKQEKTEKINKLRGYSSMPDLKMLSNAKTKISFTNNAKKIRKVVSFSTEHEKLPFSNSKINFK